jgi:hypothetical protein
MEYSIPVTPEAYVKLLFVYVLCEPYVIDGFGVE